MDNRNGNADDGLDIPEILKRTGPDKAAPSPNEVQMSNVDTDEVVTPKAKKPRKAVAKGNGAAKPTVKAQAATKVKKAAGKAAKGKAKAKTPVATDDFGFREGSVRSRAAAMYAGKGGATLEEVKDVVGSIQLNILKKLEAEGFKLKKVKEKGEGSRKVTRYFLKAK